MRSDSLPALPWQSLGGWCSGSYLENYLSGSPW